MAPVIPIIAKILTSFRRAGMPVIYTREGYRSDLADLPDWKKVHQSPQYGDHGPRGRYMITGEPCNDIIAELAPQANEPVIDKPGAGAFYATLLEQILRLRGVTHLVVVGVTTDVCVNMTIREANDRGYDVLLVEDATASYNAYFTDAVISMLRTGIACKCSRSELVLATINALGGPN